MTSKASTFSLFSLLRVSRDSTSTGALFLFSFSNPLLTQPSSLFSHDLHHSSNIISHPLFSMSDPSPQVNNAPPSPQSLQSPPLSPDAGKNISALKHDNLTPSDPQQGPLTPPATPLASGPEFSDEDFTLSNSNANTDNEGNLVSVDNTNAVSIPFDDPIGFSEISSKGDVTPVDTQSNDATDAATATAATNTATVEDDTMAKAVATTVSPEETFAAAIADGGPVSASDSAAEDVIGSGAKDVVDSTAALKPTPADATGVAGGSIVAVSNIEPLASTASSTTTADALTPVEEAIITTTEDVVVAKATTAAQDTVRCAEIDNSIESPSTVPVESPSVVPIERVSVTVTAETPPTVAVVTASCTLADSAFTTSVTEENVADSSATNETQSAEDHTVRQKDRAGQSDNELKVKEELEPAKKKSLKKNKRAEKEPVRKKEPVKNGKDKAKKWTGESVKKENEKATEESKVTQDEKETQRPSHIFIDTPNNICSFEDSEGRRLCASRVLTVSMGPLICDRHRSRHDFVYHNKYISILLVKDFKGNKSFTIRSLIHPCSLLGIICYFFLQVDRAPLFC